MGLRSWWRDIQTPATQDIQRANDPLGLNTWLEMMSYNGITYPLTSGAVVGEGERVGSGFTAYVQQAYQSNGVVFACELARVALFSQIRFAFRDTKGDNPGDLYTVSDGRNPSSPELEMLRHPWPNGTTTDLLARMLQDADFGGNAFVYRQSRSRLRRLRPDWVTIIYGSDSEQGIWGLDEELTGYLYQPGGPNGGKDPVFLQPDAVAHFAPHPDPLSPYRGMGWLTPVIREVSADSAASAHKLKFFENGATVNLALEFDPATSKEVFEMVKSGFLQSHAGVSNAYRTLFLLGAQAKPVGADFKQMDFKLTQGAGETRIAAAAGVPPIIVGLSEGLDSATYSNYGQARRRYGDLTMVPLWQNLCGSMEPIVRTPAASELWYSTADIPFLREDQKDVADIQQLEAQTIKALIEAGYKPETVVAAVTSGDFRELDHTGLFSVQLQPPMPEGPPEPARPIEPPDPAAALAALNGANAPAGT